MSNELSTLDALHYDEDAGVPEWTEAADDFLELPMIDQIVAVMAYHDENGLRPTTAAVDVLKAVIFAFDCTDEGWGTKNYPGNPSVNDYAADVATFLARRYTSGTL